MSATAKSGTSDVRNTQGVLRAHKTRQAAKRAAAHSAAAAIWRTAEGYVVSEPDVELPGAYPVATRDEHGHWSDETVDGPGAA